MRIYITSFLFSSLLVSSAAANADDLKDQLLSCTSLALESNLLTISDPNEAISQALAECHHIQTHYSQAWLKNLEGYGFTATQHVNTLVWVHSYQTALTALNQRYQAQKGDGSSI